MPAYNLRDEHAIGTVDVQFSPLTTPMVAWYVQIDGDGGEVIRQRPVLGVLLRHEVNATGEVVGSCAKMAVQWGGSDELLAAEDRPVLGTNEAVVGIYPAGIEAPDTHISSTLERIRGQLAKKTE